MEPPPSRWRQLALTTVILSSAGLALVWVFLVPIYQAPDEPMNFDYALAINAHGGLFHPASATFDSLPSSVHPHTAYLEQRCHTCAVAFHPTVKMPSDYGTWSYFVTLDREAPPVGTVTGPNKPFAVYPFGYYAVVALWVGLLHVFHDGPVFVFFGTRILSVLLLIGTLFTIDATVRRLHFGPWPALLLTAAVGFFPLTTFVASAVQTDNLSFALVSLAFYLALRIKESPGIARFHGWMGLTLGALLVTKVHFFACVALPIGVMAATEAAQAGVAWRRRVAMSLLWIAPASLLGGLYWWTTSGTSNLYSPTESTSHTLSHEARWIKQAITDYFAGTTHDSFWGSFGWLDTPLVIKGSHATEVVHTIIQGATWVLLALALFRLEQVCSRLVRVARAGRTWQAWRMVVSDPLINSYFVFTVFMLILYVRIENRFGAQGRNWLPMLLPILLVGVRYAPRALTLRKSQQVFAQAILSGTLCYCVVGSYYALPTLADRYYGEPKARHSGHQEKMALKASEG